MHTLFFSVDMIPRGQWIRVARIHMCPPTISQLFRAAFTTNRMEVCVHQQPRQKIHRRSITGSGRIVINSVRKAIRLIVVCTIPLLSSCGSAVRTVWSVEVPSPDHQWIAGARTDQTSGPGNADLSTGVYLKRAHSSDPWGTILLFQNEPVLSKQAISLTVVWLTPSHLQVTFNRVPEFYAQTIKYAGIEISVRESASGQ
jgi:hypothetical protein